MWGADYDALKHMREQAEAAEASAAEREAAEVLVRKKRYELGVHPVYKLVDTCAAEFEAYTPYLYSTYEQEDESNVTDKKKIVILGASEDG